jgi:hypothetical protein
VRSCYHCVAASGMADRGGRGGRSGGWQSSRGGVYVATARCLKAHGEFEEEAGRSLMRKRGSVARKGPGRDSSK